MYYGSTDIHANNNVINFVIFINHVLFSDSVTPMEVFSSVSMFLFGLQMSVVVDYRMHISRRAEFSCVFGYLIVGIPVYGNA